MKVKDLQKYLEAMNQEAELVVPAEDHTYRKVRCFPGTAIQYAGDLSENHGDIEHYPKGSVEIAILVVD